MINETKNSCHINLYTPVYKHNVASTESNVIYRNILHNTLSTELYIFWNTSNEIEKTSLISK